MEEITVHTIDGRGNVLLEVMQTHFSLNSEQLRREIVSAVKFTADALSDRGIKYAELKPALVPQAQRQEVALLFDTSQIADGWYGLPIFRRFSPLIPHTGTHSICLGDLGGSNAQQPWIRREFEIHLTRSASSWVFEHSTQFFCVYINNCSTAMVKAFHGSLQSYSPYIGYVDVTYASHFKTYLSTTLMGGFLKHRKIVIQQHEDDLPSDANQNTLGYPFEEAGLTCRSVPGMYFGLLLSYKIERPIFAGFERDQVYALNSITSQPIDIADARLVIDESKFEYLRREKSGTLKRLGVIGSPKATLEDMIRAKLRSNYLYSLRFRPNFSVSQFNMLLELEAADTREAVRVVAGFKYDEDERAIHLVTLF